MLTCMGGLAQFDRTHHYVVLCRAPHVTASMTALSVCKRFTSTALCVLQDPDKLINGDPAVEEIFKWGDKMRISYRGASGLGEVVGQAGMAQPKWPTDVHAVCTGSALCCVFQASLHQSANANCQFVTAQPTCDHAVNGYRLGVALS